MYVFSEAGDLGGVGIPTGSWAKIATGTRRTARQSSRGRDGLGSGEGTIAVASVAAADTCGVNTALLRCSPTVTSRMYG
jgi:hypothetical protein